MTNPDSSSKDERQRLKMLGMRYLASRSRSIEEMRTYLQKKINPDHSLTLIEELIEEFVQFKILNNEEFVKQWIQWRLNKGKGPLIIVQELKLKGITEVQINELISSISQEIWIQSAITIAEKNLKKIEKQPIHQLKQRLYRFLYSRGFTSPTINAAIDAVLGERVK
jgi:regulatory protein